MPYKKLELKNSTSWRFENDGDLEGEYLGSREAKSKNGKPITFHEFRHQVSKEVVSVLGGTVLDRILGTQVEKGQRVYIEYKGEKEGKNGTYRDFSVSLWEE